MTDSATNSVALTYHELVAQAAEREGQPAKSANTGVHLNVLLLDIARTKSSAFNYSNACQVVRVTLEIIEIARMLNLLRAYACDVPDVLRGEINKRRHWLPWWAMDATKHFHYGPWEKWTAWRLNACHHKECQEIIRIAEQRFRPDRLIGTNGQTLLEEHEERFYASPWTLDYSSVTEGKAPDVWLAEQIKLQLGASAKALSDFSEAPGGTMHQLRTAYGEGAYGKILSGEIKEGDGYQIK
ncbi:MAG: hypothetical protein C0508_01220 [Cyanobacteria bacterium PR.023]|nr:hypothetical protein [Cyanobacteria bacterium PR.3.49]MBA4073628.1 hypothetical protein [Cyanobacteria bacterium PR.023]